MSEFPSVFVTDFDGTITTSDFYRLVAERLLGPENLVPWDDYLSGKITHFEAMRRIYGSIKAPESAVLEVIRDMRPDPCLAACVKDLKAAGWKVIVASAGSKWYIDIILQHAGVDIEVHSNPGVYKEGGPLVLEEPRNSPFYCPQLGVDKAAIVKHHQDLGKRVAFAGDGHTDVKAGLLVPENLRFAHEAMAEDLDKLGQPYRHFNVWSDVVRELLSLD